MSFKAGDRVRLKPVPEDDIPEEFGTVEGPGDTELLGDESWFPCWLVRLDPEFTTKDCGDDGLREVPEDQLEVL